MKQLLIIAVLFVCGVEFMELVSYKQQQWQRAKKLTSIIIGSPDRLHNYWLSNDPNHFCADLNFDGYIDFFDYAEYLRLKSGK